MRRFEESEKFFIQALEIIKKVYGEEHQSYAVCLNNLGNLYVEMGDIDSGKRYLL
ncbi:MAG: tetratricopeptide repeat protein [Saprospiraceae bacterium]|nr:tetratricopeptide repeat protein [Candidatus Vicinibacter affinis]